MSYVNQLLLGGLAGGAYMAQTKNDFKVLYAVMALYGSRMVLESWLDPWLKQNFLLYNEPQEPARMKHDENRLKTYPLPVPNTWYRLCNSEDLTPGKVLEIRALGQVFVLWRTDDGTPVCQDAFCIHLGANLGVGGKISDNCITCPFHSWKFDSEGNVKEIPYLPKDSKCPTTKKLKTYHCKEWCGLICVYFHAEGSDPEFELPAFIEEDNIKNDWGKHLIWNIGFLPLTPVDWVDQTGDHAHFHTLHGEFYIPWTMMTLPRWFISLFPIGIAHSLKTYLGDDKEWEDYVRENNWGVVDKHLVVFTDKVGLSWRGNPVSLFQVQTREMFAGPAIMIFHIPIFIGNLKVFVSTTPVEGGSIMNVRTYVDKWIKYNPISRCIAWMLSGVSASQLMSDIVIMTNRIRMKKPLLVANDGPYNRSNNWVRTFYSANSENVGSCYKNDW